jgi:hypothetical protein
MNQHTQIGSFDIRQGERDSDEQASVLAAGSVHEVLRKSEIQGRLFAALIREELNKAEYLTLTHATTTIDVDSLPELRSFYGGVTVPSTALLYAYGLLQLVEIDNSSVGTYGGGGPKFVQNNLGKKYIAIAG